MVDQTATEQRRGKNTNSKHPGNFFLCCLVLLKISGKKKKYKGHEIDECIFVSGSQGLAVFYDNKVRS